MAKLDPATTTVAHRFVLPERLRDFGQTYGGLTALLPWQVSSWDSLTVGLLPGSAFPRSLLHLRCCSLLEAWHSCLRRMRRSV